MRRMVSFSILITFICLSAGCTFPVNDSLPDHDMVPAGPDGINYGGTSLSIAFKKDEISTASPAAKEQLMTGLVSLSQQGRYNESLYYFDQALSIDQNCSGAWVAKAVALHNLNCYAVALLSYDRALTISPGDESILRLKEVTLRDNRRRGESVRCNVRERPIPAPVMVPGH